MTYARLDRAVSCAVFAAIASLTLGFVTAAADRTPAFIGYSALAALLLVFLGIGLAMLRDNAPRTDRTPSA